MSNQKNQCDKTKSKRLEREVEWWVRISMIICQNIKKPPHQKEALLEAL
jgi:hypothetical protein